MEAIRRGAGSAAMVWSLAEITPTRAMVPLACLTASRHALTMCLPLHRIPRAHQGSTHRQHARKHALKARIQRPTATTNTWPEPLTPSVVCQRSNKTSCRTVPCTSLSLFMVISQHTSLECTLTRLDLVWEVTRSLWWDTALLMALITGKLRTVGMRNGATVATF